MNIHRKPAADDYCGRHVEDGVSHAYKKYASGFRDFSLNRCKHPGFYDDIFAPEPVPLLLPMRIAINTRFLLRDSLEGYGYFLQETIRRITENHPEHHFLLIFDRAPQHGYTWPSNVQLTVAGPPARHPLLWKWWYDVRIPAVLRKFRADVFLSCDGFCSLRTSVPQCLVVHDLAFLHYPDGITRSQLYYYKRYTPKYLQKAAAVATVSQFSKADIIQQYRIPEEKVSVVYSAVKEIFRPLNEAEKAGFREKYTGGKEFFLYVGSIHPRKNLRALLKAFSVFKKRQQTSMKLVIAGRIAWKSEAFTKDLSLYKYRDDVVLTGYLPETELTGLTASAWCLVYPSLFEGFGVPVLEAMAAEVPAITTRGSAMEEIAGDAALYADSSNFEDIAEKMKLIYKDETLRRKLIDNGRRRKGLYSWEQTAELLWLAVEKAAASS